jgi:long-chain acyl-CoA synthetase
VGEPSAVSSVRADERDDMTQTPWLDHYPADVAKSLTRLPFTHLPGLIREAAKVYAKSKAFIQVMPNGMNGRLTFQQIDQHSDSFARYLKEDLGLSAGDRVAVQMPNSLSYPIVAFGVFKAGLVLVNTNPLYKPSEMIHQFRDSGARVLVVVDMFADRLPEVIGKTNIEKVVTVKISEFFPPIVAGVIRLVQRFWNRSLPKVRVEHTRFQTALTIGAQSTASTDYLKGVGLDTVAALQYTGGTTGVSKGAMLTHGNLISNTAQMLQMNGKFIRPGAETVLTALPLYHIFAFTVNLLGFFHKGGTNILVPSPRPPSNLQRAFENYRITWVSGVNTLFNALLNERWFNDSPPKYLVASAAGGMALHEAVAERWQEVTKTPIVEGYGLTESSPVLSFNPLGGKTKVGSIGIPVPDTLIACVDDKGKPVKVGEPGELIARGPQIMKGYWNRDSETAATLKDGWLYTGDIGTMDKDGYFTIVDRKKDMILVSGFNVYPNEVEEVIASIAGVIEVGVVGVTDDKSGERVTAYVVAGIKAPSRDEIISHCRANLAGYKVPAQVMFVDELPKSPIGKILRRELRDSGATSAAEKKV